MRDLGLEGRRVFVTGAGSGIGATTAAAFAGVGAKVAAADIDLTAVQKSIAEAELASAATAIACDVSSEDSVLAAFEEAEGALGGQPQVVVNVAGIGSARTIAEETAERWDAVFGVNARGTFLVSREGLRRMRTAGGGGAIVNIASVGGQVGLRQRAAYCASKGAVIGLTKAMAVDHAEDGIRVNCICPGTIRTPWVQRMLAESGEPIEAIEARQLLGRLGEPDDVAEMAVFLASDRASFATGSAVVVDGGLTAV